MFGICGFSHKVILKFKYKIDQDYNSHQLIINIYFLNPQNNSSRLSFEIFVHLKEQSHIKNCRNPN